uniref:regulatory factor X-associated protein-like n=1 Tax=Callithrix jacchus TaxID=9483 RepID=UPI0023DD6024|nr:regulatory factor X-associated protein-like [Callithrix jacchus]
MSRRARGSGAASGVPHPATLASAAAPTLAPTPVAAAASQFTLLVMQPCAGPDEAAAPGGSVGSGKSVRYLCEGAGDGEEEAGEDETDLLDTSDPPGGGENAASLEDLEDQETPSGEGRGQQRGQHEQDLHLRRLQRVHKPGAQAAQAVDVQETPQHGVQGLTPYTGQFKESWSNPTLTAKERNIYTEIP